MASRAHKPTEETRFRVWTMAAAGHQQIRIAAVLGIYEQTLRKHYRSELDIGRDEANEKVYLNLFRIATGRTAQAACAAMFLLKTRAGYREVDKQGADTNDKPPPIHVHFPEKKE